MFNYNCDENFSFVLNNLSIHMKALRLPLMVDWACKKSSINQPFKRGVKRIQKNF